MEAKETVKVFLSALSEGNYQKAYENCQITWKNSHSTKDLKDLIAVRIKSFKVVSVQEIQECISDVNCVVRSKGSDRKITARVIKESEPFKADPKGEWGVNPISVIRNLF